MDNKTSYMHHSRSSNKSFSILSSTLLLLVIFVLKSIAEDVLDDLDYTCITYLTCSKLCLTSNSTTEQDLQFPHFLECKQ